MTRQKIGEKVKEFSNNIRKMVTKDLFNSVFLILLFSIAYDLSFAIEAYRSKIREGMKAYWQQKIVEKSAIKEGLCLVNAMHCLCYA